MPAAKNPNKPDSFVYWLCADRVPFYVGVGRSRRASHRVAFVRNLMRLEETGRRARWDFQTKLIAELLRRGHDIKDCYAICGLTKAQAHEEESREIARLLKQGYALANKQQNPGYIPSIDEAATAIEGRTKEHEIDRSELEIHIPNESLVIPDIPGPRAEFTVLVQFARTFDGYEHWGSTELCGEIANKKQWETLTELRTCLFFEHRRWRHFGEMPDKEGIQYWRKLVEMIRGKVRLGQIV
jgi:hypothetical protein